MEQAYTYVFDLHEECTRLCAELRACLQRERACLIELKVEEIPHLTLQKESQMLSLVRKRRELKDYLKLRYSVDKVSQFALRLEGPEKELWTEREALWRREWTELRETVRQNNDFLKHSLKNLFLLADNLRRCLGLPALYSAKGTQVSLQNEGKVLAASY
jgi:hypothetical protein